jgi:hypothetical protein
MSDQTATRIGLHRVMALLCLLVLGHCAGLAATLAVPRKVERGTQA